MFSSRERMTRRGAPPGASMSVTPQSLSSSLALRRLSPLLLLAVALMAVALLVFPSAPYAYANHEDGHTGPDEAPDVPFDDSVADPASGGNSDPLNFVSFQSSDSIDDRTYTAGATVQGSSALPEATTSTPWDSVTVRVVYSVTGLPDGLYLDDSRVIRGTPTAATGQPAEVTYTATGTIVQDNGKEGASQTASLTFRVTVNPAVSFSAETVKFYQDNMVVWDLKQNKWLAAGSDGKVVLPAASGGTGTLTYSLVETSTTSPYSGAASGITFDSSTRKLGGRPASLDFWYFTYSAEDKNGSAASFAVTVLSRVGGL